MSDNILEIFATSYMWLLEHMFLINVVFSFLIIFFQERDRVIPFYLCFHRGILLSVNFCPYKQRWLLKAIHFILPHFYQKEKTLRA